MSQIFRPGSVGALTDTYEKVLVDMITMLKDLDEELFIKVLYEDTDEDFKSMRNIMVHVVRCGYSYANYIRKAFGENYFIPTVQINKLQEAIDQLGQVFRYTLETLEGKWTMTEDEMAHVEIVTTWSKYDMEGIYEHAIVHIMRHQLQIEKMKMKFSA